MAAKFFIAASFLGPEKMGVVGLLLIIYAISETLTEFGLIHAVIQAKDEPELQDLDSVWWSLACRGLALACILLLFGYFYPIESEYKYVFIFSALLISISALFKSLYSPRYYLVQRHRIFNRLFLFNAFAGIVDIIICIYYLNAGAGILSIFIGLVASELLKLLTSFVFFGKDARFFTRLLNPTFKVHKYIDFGKWIWIGNCNNLILNQSDKLLTGVLLGAQQLGLYQMSSRISQLGISDVAMAIGQYLFPTLSRLNVASKEIMHATFCKFFCYMLIFSIVSASTIISLAPLLVVFLGEQWSGSILLLQILSVTMVIGSLISVLVAFIRAQGNPKSVTIASFYQLLVFVPSLILLGHFFGVIGVAITTVISTLICFGTLLHFCKIPTFEILMPLKSFLKPLFVYTFVYVLSFAVEDIFSLVLINIINALFCMTVVLYIEKDNHEHSH